MGWIEKNAITSGGIHCKYFPKTPIVIFLCVNKTSGDLEKHNSIRITKLKTSLL